MLLHCNGRKCNTTQDHKLKLNTNEVVCMNCEEPNDSISEFMKNVMRSTGDVYHSVGAKKAFMYKCPKCSIDRSVRIIDEKAVCDSCQTPLNLSGPMLEAIKSNTPRVTEELVEASKPEKELSKGVVKRRKS